jgi:hypothetical protein
LYAYSGSILVLFTINITMSNQTDPKDQKDQNEPKNPSLKPDPETLHTTDPQEHMKGPVSSSVQNIKEEDEEGDKESKEEADQKKEENI